MNQRFGSPRPVPIFGQQKEQFDAQIQAAINSLSLQIYTQLATGHIASRDELLQLNREKLHQLAKDAKTAARCFFEGIELLPKKGDNE